MSDIKRRKVSSVVACILLVTTLAIFFIVINRPQLIDWIGFGCMIVAEIIIFISPFIVGAENESNRSSSLLKKSGIYSISTIYFIISTALSLLFMIAFRDRIRIFIILQILLIAGLLITIVIISSKSSAMFVHNHGVNACVDKMNDLEDRLFVIKEQNRSNDCYQQLNKLYEAVKYSDYSNKLLSQDIELRVNELENMLGDNNQEKIIAFVDDALILLQKQ